MRKGKAAPAIVSHADRVLHPLRRTAPKGGDDPAWERMRSEDVPGAEPRRYVAWDAAAARPATYDPTTRRYDSDEARLALDGRYTVGGLECRPVLAELADHCRAYTPQAAAAITGVPAAEIERVGGDPVEIPPRRVLHMERARAAHSGTTRRSAR